MRTIGRPGKKHMFLSSHRATRELYAKCFRIEIGRRELYAALQSSMLTFIVLPH